MWTDGVPRPPPWEWPVTFRDVATTTIIIG